MSDDGDHSPFPYASPSPETPLSDIRVIDAGNLLSGPVAANLLGDFGADVIKIEHPERGDEMRRHGKLKNDIPLWFKAVARNKRSVTLNLSKGVDVFKDLVRDADVVIENYRPGTFERWGIGYDTLSEINPGLVMLRVSGYGQTGPYKDRPGLGRIAAAMSGFTNLIGEADGPPMSPAYPIVDAIAAVFGAYSVMVALHHRDATGEGQYIDHSLPEAVFRLLESNPIQYDQLGDIPKRQGNTPPYVAPGSTYETEDGEYISLIGTTESLWRRLCRAMEREELIDDPRYSSQQARIERSEEVNGLVREWIAEHTRDEVERIFDEHDVAYSFEYDIADIFDDEHYQAREALVRVPDEELGEAVVHNVVPKLSKTPGEVRSLGPKKGEHNQEVYAEELGYSEAELERLREDGVI